MEKDYLAEINQLEKAIESRKKVYGRRLKDDWDDAAFMANIQIKQAENRIEELKIKQGKK